LIIYKSAWHEISTHGLSAVIYGDSISNLLSEPLSIEAAWCRATLPGATSETLLYEYISLLHDIESAAFVPQGMRQ
jgi:hypothetical protein